MLPYYVCDNSGRDDDDVQRRLAQVWAYPSEKHRSSSDTVCIVCAELNNTQCLIQLHSEDVDAHPSRRLRNLGVAPSYELATSAYTYVPTSALSSALSSPHSYPSSPAIPIPSMSSM